MKLVLLSGGSGKRLWPLSNDSRSKQFLKILQNEEEQMESMLQRVWRQIQKAGLSDSTYIATSKAQVEMIHNQIGLNVDIVVEPERRDTFPAIALVASYIYSIVGANLDETVIVMPIDPYVEQSFYNKVKELERILNLSGADLALIGAQPTYPSEKYGYIIPNCLKEGSSDYFIVNSFKEKPCKEEAEVMIQQAALWNCGVFSFKLKYIIDMLIEKNLPIQYNEVVKQYSKFPAISFDYEVVEKAENIVAIPYKGTWKDLGTWNTLTEEIGEKLIGNGIVTSDSLNTHIINELDIPVAVIGASNLVVVASPDGILVSDKESSPRVKEVIKNNNQRPMFEERRWGLYRVLDYLKYENGQEILTRRICLNPNKNLSYQYHLKRKEVWNIISGSGEIIQDGIYKKVTVGDVIVIPPNSKHSIRAITAMELIEIQSGIELVEEDIVRLASTWEEIVQISLV